MYTDCCLYGIKTKKELVNILKITDKRMLKQEYVNKSISIYLLEQGKKRLIEKPDEELKRIQRRIQRILVRCNYPAYVFSGVKGKSFITNARIHEGKQYLFSLDISSFFPNISRDKVYRFFRDFMNTSEDVAYILTNICTVDIERKYVEDMRIKQYIDSKKIRHQKHLCTGSPCSPLLSYLVNKSLFDDIKEKCDEWNLTMSVYMDDMFFSSSKRIPKYQRHYIIKLITKYGFNISNSKLRYKVRGQVKKITGVIIDKKGIIKVPNKWGVKIIKDLKHAEENKNRIAGRLANARQIDVNYMKTVNIKSIKSIK